MNILVASNQLVKIGGSENYIYAMVIELLRLGHHVEYFTFTKGEVAERIEALGVKFKSKKSYDLILANHGTTVEALNLYGCTIQTCHGIFHTLEQPSTAADFHVSISFEVQQYLKEKNIESTIISNGIDCSRFYSKKELNHSLKSVLSLCHSDAANDFIRDCCDEIGVKFNKSDKYTDSKWNVEDVINDSDLVVGIGRSLYDAMACGRTVISYDNRDYDKDLGDGYLNLQNIQESIKFNCSGRGLQKTFDKESFINELKKYNKDDGSLLRNFALENLNIRLSVDKYLKLVPPSQRIRIKIKKFTRLTYQYLSRKIFKPAH